MDIILAGFRWKTCLVYLDDVIVFSNNFDDHLKHVSQILKCLQNAGFSLKLSKCSFFKNEVDYLGHVVSPGKLAVAQKTTEAVAKFKLPETQTHIKSFLGLCNVYRRFVPNFARVSAPLNSMLKKGEPVKLPPLNEAQLASYNALKQALISPPILRLPKKDLPYSVDTDACGHQVGVVLLQTYEDGTRHPIGYWSRTLNAAEKNYSTTERECLAVVWGCQILRPYLEGHHVKIYTDHQPLKWLLGPTDATERLARWRLRLLEFDISVEYKKGIKNQLADAISRIPTEGETNISPDLNIPVLSIKEKEEIKILQSMEDDLYDDEDHLDFILAQQEDPIASVPDIEPISALTDEEIILHQYTDRLCGMLRKHLTLGPSKLYQINDKGILVRISPRDFSTQIVLPKDLRQRVLHIAHHSLSAGHPGGTRMFTTLRKQFYWPNMALDCFHTVRHCIPCAKRRVNLRKHMSFMKLFPARRPGEHVAIDILGPLPRTRAGYIYILVITDRYSKMTAVHPLRNITALTCAKAFCEEWVFKYGQPALLLSDRGTQFVSQFFNHVCSILGIRQAFTSAYHPQTNGQVERFNRTLLGALQCFCSEQGRDWDQFIRAVAYGYNCTIHTSTGASPFDLMLTYPPPHLALQKSQAVDHKDLTTGMVKDRYLRRLQSLMKSASKKLEAAQARYKKNFDSRVRHSPHRFATGDTVFVRREASKQGESEHKLRSKVSTGHIKYVDNERRFARVRLIDSTTDTTVSFDRLVPIPIPRVPSRDPVTSVEMSQEVTDPTVLDDLKDYPALQPSLPQPSSKRRYTTRRLRPPGWHVGNYGDVNALERDTNYSHIYRRYRIISRDKNTNLYRVRWTNLSPSHDTYEPARFIPQRLVHAYHRQKNLALLPNSVWR